MNTKRLYHSSISSVVRFIFTLVCTLLAANNGLAQEAILQGRIEHAKPEDYLQLYVTGTVDMKTIEPEDDGSFTASVDLLEPTRCILYWKGRSIDDWSFAFWLRPDSTVQVTLDIQKHKKQSPTPTFSLQGACKARSCYTNLYYQMFEQQNVLDNECLNQQPDFASCQSYIQQTLQPLGELLLDISDTDFDENEKLDGEMLDADFDEEDTDDLGPAARFCDQQRYELDLRQVEAEFAYATEAERAGHSMEFDTAFLQRLAELDTTDPEDAYALSLMTRWSIVAHPERYAPLVEEAAQLRCLSQKVTMQDVRNAVAECIMQQFFLRVQMNEVDPSSPSCRPLYEELQRVTTDNTYAQFIETQLQMMDHPDLFEEQPEEEEDQNVEEKEEQKEE